MDINDNDKHLPLCSICMGSSDSQYMKYNLAVSGVILPIIGFIGIIGNSLVMTVYGSIEQRNYSTNIYLAALALSDFSMIWTAIILYSIEAWRHHGPMVLSIIYVRSAKFVFPISTMLQTTSVYFCVAAAADFFVRIVLSAKIKDKICTPRYKFKYYKLSFKKLLKFVFLKNVAMKLSFLLNFTEEPILIFRFHQKLLFMKRYLDQFFRFARLFVLSIAMISFLYNVPHFFELKVIDCIDETRNNTLSVQVCPTELRNNAFYYELYYTYMYTIFMAAGPLVIIVTLNASIVRVVFKNGASG
ncbi:hypothetical protein X798_06918 [Onchocerca flexuosa]|uniref:G-protein coupled receptors family 1 profile domain-containing protein n=1 Tax=Onchocerca flexuosa TaxID=387005 RepID=A0A238BNG6_9BILA|nr:hypothetical protein X798_06918 [Onchocerca flexuosa]